MKYVGFSEYYHDAGLSIINEDGVVEFASHSERFSGRKNDPVLDEKLWDYVTDPCHVSFYEDVETKFKHRMDYRTNKNYVNDMMSDVNTIENIPLHDSLVYDTFYDHHVSHCAGAFFTRPWESKKDTVMVSIDGAGEVQSSVIMDHNFNLLKEKHYPKSIGVLYTNATVVLGLRAMEDEYVTMGLSSYGKCDSVFLEELRNWYNDISDINPDIKSGVLFEAHGSESDKHKLILIDILQRHIKLLSKEDFASTVQKFAEIAIVEIMTEARKYGSKLVYSGGCAQNVVINSIIHQMFDEVHIAISPTDAGSSLGCAAMSWHKATGKDRLIWTPYSGYNIDREVNPKEIVDHLLEHKVCGLANGRAEFGPRALGNRSLIADVRYDVKDTVNTIKQRQKYRPFAPAILEEYADQYFEGPMNEYMQYTSKALHDYKSVTHVDGTARVQIVKKDCESVFRKVIEEYYEKTGVPMLLNTSLNIRGRPMVNNEHDARLWEQKYKVKVF